MIFFCSGARFDDGAGGDNEVQRTMLELINQLDGFDPRGNIKVLMATNRCVFMENFMIRFVLTKISHVKNIGNWNTLLHVKLTFHI